VVDPGPPHEFLGSPLRLVVCRTTVRPGAKEAKHDDPPYARSAGSLDDGASAVDMHTCEGLISDLTIDPCAMRDDVATRECCRQGVHVIDRHARPTRHDDGVRGIQPLGEVTSHESGTARYGNTHNVLLCLNCI
jgi:hypothetical protein